MTRPLTPQTLGPDQLADLRSVHADPRFPLPPVRRRFFVRAGLIVPAEPKRPPRERRGNPKVRAHVLTAAGERAIGAAPAAEEPIRNRPGTGYITERWARREP